MVFSQNPYYLYGPVFLKILNCIFKYWSIHIIKIYHQTCSFLLFDS